MTLSSTKPQSKYTQLCLSENAEGHIESKIYTHLIDF